MPQLVKMILFYLLLSFFLNLSESAYAQTKRMTQDATVIEAEIEPGKVFKDCTDCVEMVWLPKGSFTMGGGDAEANEDEKPVHTVQINTHIAVGKYPVTKGQYGQFVRESGHSSGFNCRSFRNKWSIDMAGKSWKDPDFSQEESHPVVCVSWDDAQAYAKWLSKKTGQNYRLLSEAEWEYAARAGSTTARYWGDSAEQQCNYANGGDLNSKRSIATWRWITANCDDGFAYTSPVGSFQGNKFGLYDMLGNVWQLVGDCWNANYENAPTDGSDWQSGNCDRRLSRGGGWGASPSFVRSAVRSMILPFKRTNTVGFRIARTAH